MNARQEWIERLLAADSIERVRLWTLYRSHVTDSDDPTAALAQLNTDLNTAQV